MINRMRLFLQNEAGATVVEYALLCVLIALVIIASITVIGTQLQSRFNEVSNNIN